MPLSLVLGRLFVWNWCLCCITAALGNAILVAFKSVQRKYEILFVDILAITNSSTAIDLVVSWWVCACVRAAAKYHFQQPNVEGPARTRTNTPKKTVHTQKPIWPHKTATTEIMNFYSHNKYLDISFLHNRNQRKQKKNTETVTTQLITVENSLSGLYSEYNHNIIIFLSFGAFF